MHTAPTVAAVRFPNQLVAGWVHVAQRLNMLGISIRHVPMSADDVGELDTSAGELRIRIDAEPDDQVWLLQQVWNWVAIGPHASPFGQVQPLLQLVLPQQRTPDEQPA